MKVLAFCTKRKHE